MDVVLEGFDTHIFDYIYALLLPLPAVNHLGKVASINAKPAVVNAIYRIFGLIIYFIRATFSYVFIFKRTAFAHPKYLNNQILLEIAQAMRVIPVVALFTAPLFVAEYDIIQFPFFIIFTDFYIYWIHRCLYYPKMYKHLHKPRYNHAFHPLNGYIYPIITGAAYRTKHYLYFNHNYG
ncbi:putative sterol delta 5,6-desaturase [Macrophomina phaseolina]|uniref:Sterol delta 5,6-desaturase n=1 Tax=Macrophomina phaseolina TaxID=35725 RepID=A0ABQ8FQG0_9PEZI|nr:putative sterol delta 5,6-desaturase [Macrophomina phaseolina]